MKPQFIVIEGLDGCGKSTQAALLSERFTASGIPHILTGEPSEGPVGRFAREAIDGAFKLGNETLAMLIAADRIEHVTNEILPALARNEHVICDRYYYSSFAYQGAEAAFERIMAYNEKAIESAKPGLVIFLDLDPAECIKRISGRLGKKPKSIYDGLKTLREARERYFKAFEYIKDTERIEIAGINGLDTEETADMVWKLTQKT